MGADRLVQPARGAGSGRPAAVLRLPGRRPLAGGTRSGRSGAHPGELHAAFNALCREHGAPALPEIEFMHESPFLNITLYPEEVDYPRARRSAPPGTTSSRACARPTRRGRCPARSRSGDGALVYLSLGSLGSADVELMQRLVDMLADAPHRVIVSKGPQHELLRLADNMVGAEFLPQASILPQVDLVITHGGNNTAPSASTSASRWSYCRCSGTSTTTPSASTRPASACGSTPTGTRPRSCPGRSTAARRRALRERLGGVSRAFRRTGHRARGRPDRARRERR